MKENRFTVRDVVDMSGLSERTVRRYLRDGKLKGTKLGGAWRFSKEDIDAMFVRRDFDHDVVAKTGDNIHRFVRGDHDGDAPIHACLIVDVNDASPRTMHAVKNTVDTICKTHDGMQTRIIPSRDAVRVTVVGELEHIGTFADLLKRFNQD